MRPKGIVRLFKRGRLIWEGENLFVNSGLPAMANLIAGVTSGQYITGIGFGSGAITPALTDAGLASPPAYYNAIGAFAFPSSGSVEFNYALAATDYGANGMTIQELGLFANSGNAVLPAVIGSTAPNWAASTPEAAGNLVIDGNGNLQRCTTPGTTGVSAPAWATTLNATTPDGGAIWTLAAFHTAPSPMIAHVSVPPFTYTGTGNYSGTWTLTF